MLVLSRKQNEKIIFPNLGVTVQILRVAGKTVCVGVDAPREVKILRDELAPQGTPPAAALRRPDEKELRHALRNQLNLASLALHVVRRKLELGQLDDAEATIDKALKQLEDLDRQVGLVTPGVSRAAATQRPRALLVEDDANECELLAGYLRMSGFDVDTADNGRQAMDVLSHTPRPDVVVLDMRMPQLDGPGTVLSIRSSPLLHDLKVFAVSGTPQAEVAVTLGRDGVDRWFAKPLNPAQLVDAMNHDLGTQRVSA